jgi:ubiquinone biosynthesis protein
MLLKTLIMAEGIGLQLDPQLDIFGIARPYAEQTIADHFSPQEVSKRLWKQSRDVAEASVALPRQMGDVLQRLEDGRLSIQTHEEELPRLAGALIGAANRLAVALVLAAMLTALGLFAVAVSVGQWDSTLILIISIVGGIVILITALALLFALMRGRNV